MAVGSVPTIGDRAEPRTAAGHNQWLRPRTWPPSDRVPEMGLDRTSPYRTGGRIDSYFRGRQHGPWSSSGPGSAPAQPISPPRGSSRPAGARDRSTLSPPVGNAFMRAPERHARPALWCFAPAPPRRPRTNARRGSATPWPRSPCCPGAAGSMIKAGPIDAETTAGSGYHRRHQPVRRATAAAPRWRPPQTLKRIPPGRCASRCGTAAGWGVRTGDGGKRQFAGCPGPGYSQVASPSDPRPDGGRQCAAIGRVSPVTNACGATPGRRPKTPVIGAPVPSGTVVQRPCGRVPTDSLPAPPDRQREAILGPGAKAVRVLPARTPPSAEAGRRSGRGARFPEEREQSNDAAY